MRKKPRNSDGTIRRVNQPKTLTNRSIVARWVEAETLHLKQLGMGYQAIADRIVAVTHGRQKAMVPIPQDAHFSEEYSISMQAVHRAFQRGIGRLPNAEAALLRKLDSERCEDMFLSLQTGIRNGDPKAVDSGVRVLIHKAKLNGYEAPKRIELGSKDGGAIPITLIQEAVNALDDKD
jgi:hypothetical protein